MEKLKDKRVIIAIVIAIAIIGLIVLLFVLNGGSTDLGKTSANLNQKNNDISYSITKSDEYIIVIAKNSTGKAINNIKAFFTLYDESNNVISDTDYENSITLYPNELTCFSYYLGKNNRCDHANVEFTYEQAKSDEISSYEGLKYVGLKDTKENYIYPQISTGNEVKSSHMAFEAVFYKNNQPVYCAADDEYQMDENKTMSLMIGLPKDADGNIMEYDRFELFVVD